MKFVTPGCSAHHDVCAKSSRPSCDWAGSDSRFAVRPEEISTYCPAARTSESRKAMSSPAVSLASFGPTQGPYSFAFHGGGADPATVTSDGDSPDDAVRWTPVTGTECSPLPAARCRPPVGASSAARSYSTGAASCHTPDGTFHEMATSALTGLSTGAVLLSNRRVSVRGLAHWSFVSVSAAAARNSLTSFSPSPPGTGSDCARTPGCTSSVITDTPSRGWMMLESPLTGSASVMLV